MSLLQDSFTIHKAECYYKEAYVEISVIKKQAWSLKTVSFKGPHSSLNMIFHSIC